MCTGGIRRRCAYCVKEFLAKSDVELDMEVPVYCSKEHEELDKVTVNAYHDGCNPAQEEYQPELIKVKKSRMIFSILFPGILGLFAAGLIGQTAVADPVFQVITEDENRIKKLEVLIRGNEHKSNLYYSIGEPPALNIPIADVLSQIPNDESVYWIQFRLKASDGSWTDYSSSLKVSMHDGKPRIDSLDHLPISTYHNNEYLRSK